MKVETAISRIVKPQIRVAERAAKSLIRASIYSGKFYIIPIDSSRMEDYLNDIFEAYNKSEAEEIYERVCKETVKKSKVLTYQGSGEVTFNA